MKVTSSDTAQLFTIDTTIINLTDLYVRFLPKDTLQLIELGKVIDLKLYGYPLDYELINKEIDIPTLVYHKVA